MLLWKKETECRVIGCLYERVPLWWPWHHGAQLAGITMPASPWCWRNVNYCTDSEGSLHMTSNRRRQSRWNGLILPLLFSFSLKRDFMCESIIFSPQMRWIFTDIQVSWIFCKLGGTARKLTWKKVKHKLLKRAFLPYFCSTAPFEHFFYSFKSVRFIYVEQNTENK